MRYQLSEISSAINAKLKLVRETVVSNVFIDSRNILNPKDSLFFAISGKNNNGHNYIEELIERGVKNFVIEAGENIVQNQACNYLVVENSLNAFQQFAAWHRSSYNLPVVGITGSNGKTIVKEWLFHLLDGEKTIVRNPKSYNSQVGVPLSVNLIENNHDLGIFEAGISMPGEMENLKRIIQPEIGIFTNIGDAHQENFKSVAQKVREKLKLFIHCQQLIYSADYELIDTEVKSGFVKKGIVLFTWSKNKKADLSITQITQKNKFTQIVGTHKGIESEIKIPFVDDASIENAIHAWAFLLANEFLTPEIGQKFESLPSIGMRLELMQGINGCSIINDTYNSDLNSIKIALDFLKRQKQHENKCLIISDILQSGESSEILYQKLNDLISSSNVNTVIGIGSKISKYFAEYTASAKFFRNTTEFLESKLIREFENEAILIKGAREFEFEKISEVLQQKTHRTVLEISLEALESNLNYFRSLLNPETKVLIMVKAFSYGSGSHEIAHFLEHQRVDYLGVAFTDEGVALRKAGVNLPIIVMNPEEGSFRSIINYNLEPEIHNFRSLEKFHKTIEQTIRSSYPVHIKIDTGMKRLGFDAEEINELVEALQKHKYLEPQSIFSHLVAGAELGHHEFSLLQIEKFQKASDYLQKFCKRQLLRHILNSGGIENYPEAQFDMVRLGIGLYGISARDGIKLQNISTLKSHVSQIRQVKKDETIGYGRTGILKRDSRIAILPIGYADGLNRKLSNGAGHVVINGKKAPFVGNICMDMCMVDVTDIETSEGEEVIVFGEEIPITEIAEKLGTIPYEVLTSVSQRVKRVYVH
jgi:alanine racemase